MSRVTKRGPMLLPEIDSDRDPEDATDRIINELRRRYPNARKWTIRTVKGECQAFVKGVREFSEADRAAVEVEMKKAKRGR